MKADRVALDTNALISPVPTQTGPPRRVVDLVSSCGYAPLRMIAASAASATER